MNNYDVLIGKTIESVESIHDGQELIIHFTDKTSLKIEEGDFPYSFYLCVLENEDIK